MAKSYRPVLRDQPMLLPPDMRDWLPDDHVVWFVLETVDLLDTSGLERLTRRSGGAGAAGYDPRMLLALLVYGYCQGVRSSRHIERLCSTDVAFRIVCAQDGPDHATIARFRAEAGEAFTDLFGQVLMIAAQAGLGRFATVAIDGTKISANASIDANRGREWFDRHASDITAEAAATDQTEDAAASNEADRDRLGGPLSESTSRRERIRLAARELQSQHEHHDRADAERDARARSRAEQAQRGKPPRGRIPQGRHQLAEARAHLAREIAAHQAKLDRYDRIVASGNKPMGRRPVPLDESTRVARTRKAVARAQALADQSTADSQNPASRQQQLPKIVANTTDPASRIMPTRRGYIQGYNVQVAVTGDQLIAAVSVGQSSNDQHSFVPMMHASQQTADRLYRATGHSRHRIGTILADAGYNRNANLTADGPERLIALGKSRDDHRNAEQMPTHGPPPQGLSPREANTHRLRTPEGQSLYKRRGATVEPAIGNFKKILDRFAGRGLHKAASEAHLAAIAFNLMKLHKATTS